MSYELREEPFTEAEVRAADDQHIDGVIAIDLDVAIENTLEGFLDALEYSMLGNNGVLSDLEYTVVGNGMHDMLHIRVSGFVELTADM